MTKLTLILALNDPHDARVSKYYSYSKITPLAKIPRTNTLKVMSLTCNSVQYFQPMNTLANFSSSSQPASPDHPSSCLTISRPRSHHGSCSPTEPHPYWTWSLK